ncbi:MAG: hypothetical protein M9963_07095 [Kiritimatiellae bacterium]|nr:hypothetical protein [Kiritimatiellia bacterium]MCO5061756.1 hypothetical protein [Kiritimatiellia bacterium]MCO6399733.1 hypothetical protein [Verrucomicrobiota bacterium]
MNKTFAKWIDRITPSCEKVAELASERLDRPLTFKERLSCRLHFLICYFCRRYHDQLDAMHTHLCKGGEKYGQDPQKCVCTEDKNRIKEACKKQSA